MLSFENRKCLYCNKSVPSPANLEDSHNFCNNCSVTYCISMEGRLWHWFFTVRVGLNLYRVDFINTSDIVTTIKRISKYDHSNKGYILYDSSHSDNLIFCEPSHMNITPWNAKDKIKTILTFM